jgi:hypothetical protein
LAREVAEVLTADIRLSQDRIAENQGRDVVLHPEDLSITQPGNTPMIEVKSAWDRRGLKTFVNLFIGPYVELGEEVEREVRILNEARVMSSYPWVQFCYEGKNIATSKYTGFRVGKQGHLVPDPRKF